MDRRSWHDHAAISSISSSASSLGRSTSLPLGRVALEVPSASQFCSRCSVRVAGDIEVDEQAKVVAGPYAVDRLVEHESRLDYLGAGLRVSVPGSGEHVVESPAVTGLAHDGVHLLRSPRVARIPGEPA